MVRQQRTDLLFEKDFALGTVDGRHSRSCTQKLADFCEPEREWDSQHTRMTLVKVPGFQPLTDHELLQLTRFAMVMTGLVLRCSNITAVIKSFLQHSKTSKCRYKASFEEAHTNDTWKYSVSLRILQGAGETPFRR